MEIVVPEMLLAYLLLGLHPGGNLLRLDPRLLLLGQIAYVAFGRLPHLIEVVDDYTDEQVHDEVGPHQDEHHEEEAHVLVGIANRLHAYSGGILRDVHEIGPTFRGGNFEQAQKRPKHVVK